MINPAPIRQILAAIDHRRDPLQPVDLPSFSLRRLACWRRESRSAPRQDREAGVPAHALKAAFPTRIRAWHLCDASSANTRAWSAVSVATTAMAGSKADWRRLRDGRTLHARTAADRDTSWHRPAKQDPAVALSSGATADNQRGLGSIRGVSSISSSAARSPVGPGAREAANSRPAPCRRLDVSPSDWRHRILHPLGSALRPPGSCARRPGLPPRSAVASSPVCRGRWSRPGSHKPWPSIHLDFKRGPCGQGRPCSV